MCQRYVIAITDVLLILFLVIFVHSQLDAQFLYVYVYFVLGVKLVIYKDHNEMHGQQNIKYCSSYMQIESVWRLLIQFTKCSAILTLLQV